MFQYFDIYLIHVTRCFVLEIIHFRAIGSCEITEFVTQDKLMKRTRTAAKIQQQNTIENNKNDEATPKIDQTTSMVYFIISIINVLKEFKF